VIRQEWSSLLLWLTFPAFANDKRAAGAWCPTALLDGVVKGGTGPVSLLVADVDDCTEGAVERSVEALRSYKGAVIHTASATKEKPKHRIVLLPSRPLLPDEFPLAWSKMASALAAEGIAVDRGCKNINRLYFACVARSPESWLGAHVLEGEPVPVDAMLEASRAEAEQTARARAVRPEPRPVPVVGDGVRDRWVAAAIKGELSNLCGASEGGRHDALLKAAWALARIEELSEADIREALLEAFVAVAGEPRRREAERAIRDAVKARKGAA
jgi:hypothetical protein